MSIRNFGWDDEEEEEDIDEEEEEELALQQRRRSPTIQDLHRLRAQAKPGSEQERILLKALQQHEEIQNMHSHSSKPWPAHSPPLLDSEEEEEDLEDEDLEEEEEEEEEDSELSEEDYYHNPNLNQLVRGGRGARDQFSSAWNDVTLMGGLGVGQKDREALSDDDFDEEIELSRPRHLYGLRLGPLWPKSRNQNEQTFAENHVPQVEALLRNRHNPSRIATAMYFGHGGGGGGGRNSNSGIAGVLGGDLDSYENSLAVEFSFLTFCV